LYHNYIWISLLFPSGEIRIHEETGKQVSLCGMILTNNGWTKGSKNKQGYLIYDHREIHRLIAQTFIENPLNKFIVNHINGINHNYRMSNCSYSIDGVPPMKLPLCGNYH
jgi:hypothetical protein